MGYTVWLATGEQIMTTTKIAAYDDQAIWGVGTTCQAARADARQWVNAEDAADLDAGMKTAPMSADLAEHVATVGGNCAFELRDGVLGLCAA